MDKERKLEIEQKAEELIEKYIGTETVVDVVRLAKNLNFKVKSIPLKNKDDGFIIIDTILKPLKKESDRLIVANANYTLEKNRFILAHEIGHYILSSNKHKDILFVAREKTYGRSEEENEMDYFAACLLMPKTLFTKKYKEFKKQIGDNENILAVCLAKYFKVPVKSAKRRMIEELKLFGVHKS